MTEPHAHSARGFGGWTLLDLAVAAAVGWCAGLLLVAFTNRRTVPVVIPDHPGALIDDRTTHSKE